MSHLATYIHSKFHNSLDITARQQKKFCESLRFLHSSFPGMICIGICFSATNEDQPQRLVRTMGITMEPIDEARGHVAWNVVGRSIESAERHFPYYFCFHCKQGSLASGRVDSRGVTASLLITCFSFYFCDSD